MSSLAIIGTGIAGLGCAHFLHRHFDLTLFEQAEKPGGHANTLTHTEPPQIADPAKKRPALAARPVPIDTGFMVYNEVTYPHLTRLFRQLGVASKKTDMSFGVRHADTGLEYCGSSLNHLFAQRKNLLRPRFWRMLSAINRFNKEAIPALADPETSQLTLGEYVRRRAYGDDFFQLYLVPMSSAVWSTPPELMLSFPAATLLRFFHNHGFLGLHTQHQWMTVAGGSQAYVEKITAPFRENIRLGQKATRVLRHPRDQGVTITTATGATHTFDKVILACHGDQALRLLVNPTPTETRLLGEFHYQPNTATVHTDASVMPKTRLAWSAWNYEITRDATGQLSTATHYWMNKLQGVSDRENYFVTINRPDAIAPEKVLKRIEYDHPLFSLGATRAQAELPALNQLSASQTTYFAGSYFKHGFHEDAFASAVALSEILLKRDPWNC
ncbi:NADP transhydrogenase subunit alpha [Nibricoccus aquaticus]|uniref:NADP transhydrogenase subunit alpha n=1 Tax=Nibricoccus aquaticus TaxID=2576891 RepID=A0A290QHR2_9BACT|nr:FAD-dependent oxidoreductase [Nibricoccus aquaticus]ATC63901.1 NADP transhydrogenase subunit alpha [Nibricoccus aquaticus]